MDCPKYDIFISYRREGGETMAILLHDRLRQKGYNVFLDIESLNSGTFNTKLLDVIDNCKDFILVCSKDCLDRCTNDGDWVRLEIIHAFKNNKNIIPIMLRGFNFPDNLPEDIAVLSSQNGVSADRNEYFDAAIDRLADKFLKSKPIKAVKKTKRIIAGVAALAVIFGLGIFIALSMFDNDEITDIPAVNITTTLDVEIIESEFTQTEPVESEPIELALEFIETYSENIMTDIIPEITTSEIAATETITTTTGIINETNNSSVLLGRDIKAYRLEHMLELNDELIATIMGVEYKYGYITYVRSTASSSNNFVAYFNLNREYTNLTASYGPLDNTIANYTMILKIYGDDEELASYETKAGDSLAEFSLDVTGVEQLKFVYKEKSNKINYNLNYGIVNINLS